MHKLKFTSLILLALFTFICLPELAVAQEVTETVDGTTKDTQQQSAPTEPTEAPADPPSEVTEPREMVQFKVGEPVALFDGETLDGWVTSNGKPVTEGWKVVDGTIHRESRSGNIFYEQEVGDFELTFEWKIEKGGNNGLKYRVRKYGGRDLGCEYQILGETKPSFSRGSCGSLYVLYEPNKKKQLNPPDEWNKGKIVAHGGRLEHWLNGEKIVEADLGTSEWTTRLMQSKFSPYPDFARNTMGRIMLTEHGSKVWYRNLVLTPLQPKEVPPLAPDDLGFRIEKLAAIPAAMREFVDAGEISGAVTLIAKEGRTVQLAAVGKRDIDSNAQMQGNSIFAVASMTKPVTATAMMILVDEGKVKLTDPVADYIPEFKDVKLKNGDALQRPITIFDLMTHTSGVVGSQQNEGSLEETAAAFAARPLGFQPGEKWQYSPGLSICGRVIEVAAEQPLEEFLKERLFEPLGMKDTTFNPNKKQKERLVTLYKPGEEKGELAPAEHWINDVSEKRSPNPSGGLFSTAADMAKFYQMVLNRGNHGGKQIVSPESVKKMTTIHTGELTTGFTPGNGWGLGWCVVRDPQGVSAALSPGSFGHGGAFGTQGWIDPSREMVYVLMIQRTGFGNSDASDIRSTLHKLATDALVD